MKQAKQFKVAAISDNTNSFGLYGVVLVARDGQAFEVGTTSLWPHGQVLSLTAEGTSFNFAEHGIEIPRALPAAPPKVIKEVWN